MARAGISAATNADTAAVKTRLVGMLRREDGGDKLEQVEVEEDALGEAVESRLPGRGPKLEGGGDEAEVAKDKLEKQSVRTRKHATVTLSHSGYGFTEINHGFLAPQQAVDIVLGGC